MGMQYGPRKKRRKPQAPQILQSGTVVDLPTLSWPVFLNDFIVNAGISKLNDSIVSVAWENIRHGLALRENEHGRLRKEDIYRGEILHPGSISASSEFPSKDQLNLLVALTYFLRNAQFCYEDQDYLVFPDYVKFSPLTLNSVLFNLVNYKIQNSANQIYATLISRLINGNIFAAFSLARNTADFTIVNVKVVLRIQLESVDGNSGVLGIFLTELLPVDRLIHYIYPIQRYLEGLNTQILRTRFYHCPLCKLERGDQNRFRKKLTLMGDLADVNCEECPGIIPLWDDLEALFADEELKQSVGYANIKHNPVKGNQFKSELLADEVRRRIHTAGQKYHAIEGTNDDGIDASIEFTDQAGLGVLRGVYLQLKAGNSYLRKRLDGKEVFSIKKDRWSTQWANSDRPVMLVIGSFDQHANGERLGRFEQVRWMEITSVLKRKFAQGAKVKSIVFDGEELTTESILRWHSKMTNK